MFYRLDHMSMDAISNHQFDKAAHDDDAPSFGRDG
jgi:hypothetical protein